jgi:hypothetical protein
VTGRAAQLKSERLPILGQNVNAPKIAVDMLHNPRRPAAEVDDRYPCVDARNGSGWRGHAAILAHDRMTGQRFEVSLVSSRSTERSRSVSVAFSTLAIPSLRFSQALISR